MSSGGGFRGLPDHIDAQTDVSGNGLLTAIAFGFLAAINTTELAAKNLSR